MALSGAQKALMYARAGLARSGATRSGYFLPTAIITIDNGGTPVDISQHVVHNGWSVSLNINDEVDTATIALLPSCPFVPQARSQIKIGAGSASNLVFGGVVLTVQRTRRPGPDPRYWYDLTCIDWTAIFDAHLVVADYPAQSATLTIRDLVQRFTRGYFTTAGVPANLPTVAGMSIINERPSTVIRRITNKLGGGFYLDANRVLRAWSSTIPSPIVEPAPVPLTDHLATLKTFRVIEDASQQRTRVWIEGRRTSTRLGVPGGISSGLTVPVTDGGIFPLPGDIAADNFARIGSVIGAGPPASYSPASNLALNPPGTTVITAMLPGNASVAVASTASLPATGWCDIGGQVLQFSVFDTQNIAVPASGYGSIQAPAAVGTPVIPLPYLVHDPRDRRVIGGGAGPLFDPVASRTQPDSAPAVLVIMQEDATAATAIATREASDGFYEHLVQDGRYSPEGARARAAAELADFAQPILTYEWDTDDINADPGRMQHIALTEGTPLTTDVRITNVTITPIATGHPPRRHVRAAKIQTAGVVDVWIDDEN